MRNIFRMSWIVGSSLLLFVAARAAGTTRIDNDVAEGTLGRWAVDVDTSGNSEEGELTAHRFASDDITTENVIYAYTSYVDVGATGAATQLDGTTPVTDAMDPDKVSSTGTFQGDSGQTITWTATSSIADGSPTMVTRYEFTAAEGTLGHFRFLQYLDEDVEGSGDDVFFTRGSVASRNLQLVTVDDAEVYGVSQSGAFDTAGGLTNATFAGWAAGPYSDVEDNIQGDGQAVSPSGTIFGLDSFTHPQVGPARGPEDITSVMAWDVNASATHTVIIATLGGVPQAPAGCTPGDLVSDGGPEGRVTLTDVLLLYSIVLRRVPASDHDVQCGDLAPGSITCRRRKLPFATWCPQGDGRITLADLEVELRLALRWIRLGCDGCSSSEDVASLRVPGDLVPDGRVDVADVVKAQRLSVGLDEATGTEALVGDVAPAEGVPVGGLRVVSGDGRVDVADVVTLLRASVGFDQLAWKERTLDLVVTSDVSHSALLLDTPSWPAWADVTRVAGPCLDGAGDMLREGDGAAWSCLTGDALQPAGPATITFTYRAPEAVDPGTLGMSATIVDPSNAEAAAAVAPAP